MDGNHDSLMHDYAKEAQLMLIQANEDVHALRVNNADKLIKERILRSMHALKGGAAFFEREDIVHLCHSAEGRLDGIEVLNKRNAILLLDDLLMTISILLQKIDQVSSLIEDEEIRHCENSEFVEVLSMLPSMAKSVGHRLGKDVDVVILHHDIQLPKSIVEALLDPLVHLVRNSVDHGIEPSSQRSALKKPHVGKITLDCTYTNHILKIVMEDDGSGLDEAKIKEKIIQKKLMDAAAVSLLDTQAIWQLIFLPGFSTKDEVTEISGRGIGMDVVKTVVENLSGRLTIHSVPYQGTRIEISIPVKEG